MKWWILAAGGAAGTIARYTVSGVVHRLFGSTYPYGTLAVNMIGCFFIGFLAVASEHKFLLAPQARLCLMVGFCGAFTTFSTFIMESAFLVRDGQSVAAFINVLVSAILGFMLFRAGVLLGDII